LAAATFILSGMQLGWFAPQEAQYVAFVLIAFAFPLQLVSSIFGFLSCDPVAGTGMGILGGSWLLIGLVKYTSPPSQTSHVLGVFLILASVALIVPVAGSALGKLVPAIVLLATAIRFLLTGIYQLSTSPGIEYIAAIVGLALAVAAFYAALALEIEDVRRATVLPVLRRGVGKASVEGNMDDQLKRVEREAGVREQL
jgi:succinate-acetate transporter protein